MKIGEVTLAGITVAVEPSFYEFLCFLSFFLSFIFLCYLWGLVFFSFFFFILHYWVKKGWVGSESIASVSFITFSVVSSCLIYLPFCVSCIVLDVDCFVFSNFNLYIMGFMHWVPVSRDEPVSKFRLVSCMCVWGRSFSMVKI